MSGRGSAVFGSDSVIARIAGAGACVGIQCCAAPADHDDADSGTGGSVFGDGPDQRACGGDAGPDA